MHAVVGMVLLDPERTEEQLGFLRDVIAPNVERRPGLVRAPSGPMTQADREEP